MRAGEIATSFASSGEVHTQMTELLDGLTSAPATDGIAKQIWTDIVETHQNLNAMSFTTPFTAWTAHTTTVLKVAEFLDQTNGGIVFDNGDILLFPINIVSTTYNQLFYFRFTVTV
jgi:hypothetical protein